MKNRTTDLAFWAEHELKITETEGLLIHYLRKPDTMWDSVKFINTNGILVVTGDYGNWIFCREFHPSPNGKVSDGYWAEKLRIDSVQKSHEYDSEGTEELLRKGLESELEDYGYKDEKLAEMKEFYEHLLKNTENEHEYVQEAFFSYERPDNLDSEDIPFAQRILPRLNIIFDAFEEICRRLKETETQQEIDK